MRKTTIGILVGGMSRRMGRHKALMDVDGTTLLARTLRVAMDVCDDVVLLGQPPFPLAGAARDMEILRDQPSGAGPIGGLNALLLARPANDCLLLACDMPRVEAPVLRRMIGVASSSDADAVVARTGAGPDADASKACWHPCCAVYRSSISGPIGRAVAAGEFRMTSLLATARVQAFDLIGDEAACVVNWNHPGDVPG